LGRRAEDFGSACQVELRPARGAAQRAVIEWVRERRGRLVLKFRGVDSITAARELAGAEVCVPFRERRALPQEEYYHSDLVGCQVVERRGGRVLGVVTGWQEFGAAPLLEVDTGAAGEPLLVPFARSICVEIEPDARRILVELPEGLKDLNGR
jgi:16S rRNA processing protein RimM